MLWNEIENGMKLVDHTVRRMKRCTCEKEIKKCRKSIDDVMSLLSKQEYLLDEVERSGL